MNTDSIKIDNMQVLRALLDVKRQQIVLAKRTDHTATLVEDSYAFAMDHRICPIFHIDDADPFDGAYTVGKVFVTDVVTYCDKKWLAGEPLSFYDLEARFGRDSRMELIFTLRYAALNGRFDTGFYRGLSANCPTEAHGLNDPFSVAEVSLL